MHESSGMTTPSEINQALCQRNTRYVHSCRFAWLNPVKQNKNTALAGNPLPRLTRTGQPVDGTMLRVAERRNRAAYPELAAGGPHTLVVKNLKSEALECGSLSLRAGRRLPPSCRAGQAQRARPGRGGGGANFLSVEIQQAVASTGLGSARRPRLGPRP